MAVAQERWADPETLARLADWPCLRCLSDSELMIALAIILCKVVNQDVNADCSAEALIENAKCYQCFSDRQVMQIIIGLMATWAVDNRYLDSADDAIADGACLKCLPPKLVRAIIASLIGLGLEDGTLFCTP